MKGRVLGCIAVFYSLWICDGHVLYERQSPTEEGSGSGSEPCKDFDVRLVGEMSSSRGIVEVCSNGAWGVICADIPTGWTQFHAMIVCGQLGFTKNSSIAVKHDNSRGPSVVSFTLCSDAEKESLAQCSNLSDLNPLTTKKLTNCDFSGGVVCTDRGDRHECNKTGDIRLMNGSETSTVLGRVEVCIDGKWGTVCDTTHWDGRDAAVVCRTLGINSSYPIGVNSGEFGTGTANTSMPILLRDVNCTGQESTITDCTHRSSKLEFCMHSDDAGVVCQAVNPECEDGDIRLGSPGLNADRVVQVCFTGIWGVVCGDDFEWDRVDAAVACKQLGMILESNSTEKKPSDAIVMLSLLNCTGSESRLADCPHAGINFSPSSVCSQIASIMCKDPDSPCDQTQVLPIVLGSLVAVFFFLLVAIIGGLVVFRVLWPRKTHLLKKDRPQRIGMAAEQEYTEMEVLSDISGRQSVDLYAEWRDVLKHVLLDESQLALSDCLGEGCFGTVYSGTLTTAGDEELKVAVKTLKERPTVEGINDFVGESVIMLGFDHPNVLKLLGVCFDTHDKLPLIVLTFMANGDLKSYLAAKRGSTLSSVVTAFPEGLDLHTVNQMCKDISCGMDYLASSSFIHRDLAARNCMVSEEMVVQIADFGLSRDVYSKEYYRLGTKTALPVKWMAPESLNDNMFTEKTDVWAFGVVCWEVFSLGSSPYPGVDNHEIPDYIADGRRLKKPRLCPREVYQIMQLCWKEDASERPSFTKLAQMFEALTMTNGTGATADPETPFYANLEKNGIVKSQNF